MRDEFYDLWKILENLINDYLKYESKKTRNSSKSLAMSKITTWAYDNSELIKRVEEERRKALNK